MIWKCINDALCARSCLDAVSMTCKCMHHRQSWLLRVLCVYVYVYMCMCICVWYTHTNDAYSACVSCTHMLYTHAHTCYIHMHTHVIYTCLEYAMYTCNNTHMQQYTHATIYTCNNVHMQHSTQTDILYRTCMCACVYGHAAQALRWWWLKIC